MLQLLEFIAALAALIFIHETGHYLACRLFKIEVDEFGFGFPPRIAKLFTFQNTEFTLNWIPLGGFVRPRGENDPSIPGSLAGANPWVRIGVYLAGPLSNILLAVVLYAIIISRIGITDPDRTNVVLINGVVANSPAAGAGIQVDDIVLQVNDIKIDSTTKLHDAIYANLDQLITVQLQRGDQTLEVSLTPRSNPPEC